MTAASSSPPRRHIDDTPSVGTVLRSPALFTRECLAGVMTSLALVPEVISFSLISGVNPRVALVASIVLGLVMSLLGGRAAMVTAAAGSVALVIGPMIKANGLGYLLPTVVLAGLVQIAFGATGMARVMRYVPRSVMIGFVNALGILIFFAQIPHVVRQTETVYVLFALTVLIVQLFPYLTKAVPSPLVAIVIVTGIAMAQGLLVPSVGGNDSTAAPFGVSELTVPPNLDTLHVIWTTALSVAFVGLLESLLTAKLVDELTDTRSNKGRESWALGIANIAAGLCGGIAGCAMIGQTVVNVQIGRARTRVSTVAATLMLLLLVTQLSSLMAQIPMVALSAVMMIVALKTVNWKSLSPATLRRLPLAETIAMFITVAITVWTGNLAIGIVCGVIVALASFAHRVATAVRAERSISADGSAVRYDIHGPLFFGSSNDLVERFSYAEDPAIVSVDLTHSQIWDASTVAALDAIATKYLQVGSTVSFTGLDSRSRELHAHLTGHL